PGGAGACVDAKQRCTKEPEASPVLFASTGYIESIDEESLIAAAEQYDLLIELKHRPGQFVEASSIFAMVSPKARVTQKIVEQIQSFVLTESRRTPYQDVEFAIHQLAEIAVRALSPSMNDPFTATTCVDWLGVALTRIAQKEEPCTHRCDKKGNLRIIATAITFDGVADAAFNQIRQFGSKSVAVMIRMLETIAVIAPHTRTQQQRAVLLRHARMIYNQSLRSVKEPYDLECIEDRYQQTLRLLDGSASRSGAATVQRASHAPGTVRPLNQARTSAKPAEGPTDGAE
ncbi:MAG TPA: DUF2254 family protein, partial [Planctomycetota bacterium]|nr:DUF2254 family protein [Planctomycetota bacterium]